MPWFMRAFSDSSRTRLTAAVKVAASLLLRTEASSMRAAPSHPTLSTTMETSTSTSEKPAPKRFDEAMTRCPPCAAATCVASLFPPSGFERRGRRKRRERRSAAFAHRSYDPAAPVLNFSRQALMPSHEQDAQHIATALQLASAALRLTDPNPRVGCVLCDAQGRVLGQGHTQQAGGPHAEVV